MKPFELLGQAVSRDNTVIKLVRRDDEYILVADGAILMSSRMHGSEEALATFGCELARRRERPSVLVGGLGMGFTLRATLDLLPPAASIVVAELLPAVVEWNRGALGPLARHPLNDKRVEVITADVFAILSSRPGRFDVVLLDVDNGPAAFTATNNSRLYDERGIAAAHAALKVDGVLAVWAAQADRQFEQRMHNGGFEGQVQSLRGRLRKGGPRHTIFLGRKL